MRRMDGERKRDSEKDGETNNENNKRGQREQKCLLET